VDAPLAAARGSRVWVRREASETGEAALTDWVVARRFPGRTLLRVFPRTGRRHQIRVHLASMGHPIEGDLLYGRPDADYLGVVRSGLDPRAASGGPLRQMLHCARLEFPSPSRSGERVAVEAPVPPDLAAALGVG
jgi:23S rRNA pseudouridine1911/1915/1917 synthase